MRFFIFAFLALAIAVSARADGGSVGFNEDAIPMLQNSPHLIEFIQKTLDIEDVGWAQNGGRSFRNPVGDRILPYGFRAKPKGQVGPYTVLVVIEKGDTANSVVLTIVPVNSSTPAGDPAAAAK